MSIEIATRPVEQYKYSEVLTGAFSFTIFFMLIYLAGWDNLFFISSQFAQFNR
jgi:hypothetical protein